MDPQAAKMIGAGIACIGMGGAGVGVGSLCWVTLLATGTAAARRALGLRAMRIADACAGVGLIFFGCALALRAD